MSKDSEEVIIHVENSYDYRYGKSNPNIQKYTVLELIVKHHLRIKNNQGGKYAFYEQDTPYLN